MSQPKTKTTCEVFGPKSWVQLVKILSKDDCTLYRIVGVLWEDSCHSRGDEIGGIYQFTVGLLRALNRDSISVSMDLSEEGVFEETTTILKANVRQIYLLSHVTLC